MDVPTRAKMGILTILIHVDTAIKGRVDTGKKGRVDTLKKGRVDTSTLCANVRLLRSSASVHLFVMHLPQVRVSVYAAMFLHEHFFNVCHLFMCVLAHL